MLTRSVLLHGSEQPLPTQTLLRAGPLSLIYTDGDLRAITLGSAEILRRVYVAVRDHNWGTVPTTLHDVRVQADEEAFSVEYEAENVAGEVDFHWHGSIVGEPTGKITFRMEGECRLTFWRNRIGFCVLHPMACAGRPCVVEHVDGRRTEGAFPQAISPHQPFMDIRAIRHEVEPGVWAEVRLEGDTFEMEDQRNWTDASYKTYSTPLALPFPVQVQAGTRVAQMVMLTLEGTPSAAGHRARAAPGPFAS